MTPAERIAAAVDLNPDRARVTVRRDDVRAILAQCPRVEVAVVGIVPLYDRLMTTPVRLVAVAMGVGLSIAAGFVAHG